MRLGAVLDRRRRAGWRWARRRGRLGWRKSLGRRTCDRLGVAATAARKHSMGDEPDAESGGRESNNQPGGQLALHRSLHASRGPMSTRATCAALCAIVSQTTRRCTAGCSDVVHRRALALARHLLGVVCSLRCSAAAELPREVGIEHRRRLRLVARKQVAVSRASRSTGTRRHRRCARGLSSTSRNPTRCSPARVVDRLRLRALDAM